MGALDTMADWQPDEGILNQIIQLCAMSAQAKDSATHKQVYAELEKFKQMQDYSLYQCWVFFMCENQNVGVRQMAGLQLKEFIKLHGVQAQQHLPQLVVVIRQCLGQALTKPHDAAVRRTLSTLVTQMVTSLGVWPELLQALVVGLQNQDLTVIDLSMSCLVKLSEDSPEKLDEGPAGQTPLDAIIPIMIQAMAHPTQANFRLHALNFTNQLLLMWPDSLEQNLMGYLQNLFRLDSDPSEEVRQKVYVAVASLTEDRVHVLQEHLSQVIGFVLKGTNDPCEDVKREATEFWSILADVAQAKDLLKATLPQLLPVLLTNMQYSELEDIDEGEDEAVPDKIQNIRPRNYQGQGEKGEEEEEDDEEDDDDDDDEEEASLWNLRKSSATALDLISNRFHDEILPFILPIIKQMLENANWRAREAGVLAMGAIAEGCRLGMNAHLPEVIPMLYKFMQDTKPLVRSISCWTVGRYSTWVVQAQSPEALWMLTQQILQRIMDKNKKVQAAACSVFATLEEEAQGELIPLLEPIVQNMMVAFSTYQTKNLSLLLDTLSALADSVGAGLAQPALVQAIVPPILEKWGTFEYTDRTLFPLFECLTSICQAVGEQFQAYAPAVFQRCHQVIHDTLMALKQGVQIDKELIVCSLDLSSAICDGLGSRSDIVSQLIQNSQLLPLVIECIQLDHAETCQSAFALIGDLSKSCLPLLGPFIPQLLPAMGQTLNPQLVIAAVQDRGARRGHNPLISVSNNACWAMGEIAKRVGVELKAFYPSVVESLVQLMIYEKLNPALLQNISITLGRFSHSCADVVAPSLGKIARTWCFRICRMRNDTEKEDSCVGLCNCILQNAQDIVPSFVPFLIVVNSWLGRAPATLQGTFRQLLEAFTQQLAMPVSKWLSDPNVLQSLACPSANLTGLDVVEAGIGWDANWQQRRWDPVEMAREMADQGYTV